MLNRRGFISCAICTTASFAALQASAQTSAPGQAPAAPLPGAKRTVFGKAELPGSSYVSILMEAEFDAGFKVARHTHPGVENGLLLTGGGVLSVRGQPDRIIKAEEGFQIPSEVPHAFQNGGEKTRLAITYVVEKDRPLASPAPE